MPPLQNARHERSVQAHAAAVALQRRAIRRSLLEWSRHCGYEPAAHHRLLIEKLTAVADGGIKNLIVCMPPGSAKSTYGMAAGRWALTSGGTYLAAGVGGAIVGHRADVAVIDDPIRGAEDADSKVVRDKTWEWYKSDLITRLKPGGSIILILTRWHLDDICGRILAEAHRTGEQWSVISLPAEALDDDPLGRAPGEFLWGDDKYGFAKTLKNLKGSQTPRNWSALYQQSPVIEEGNFFKEEWLRPYTQLPPIENFHVYGASDFAVTSDGGDWTVHALVGIDPDDRMYLLDLWRKRTSTEQWIDSYCELVLRWKPLEWGFEGGQIKSAVGPFLDRRAKERKAFTYIRTFPSRHDKSVRAQAIRGRMAMQGLYVPTHAHWYAEFLGEVLSFPAGKHDDQVDCLSLIGQMLTHISRGHPSAPPKPIKVLSPPPGDDRFIGATLDDLWEIHDSGGSSRRERV